MQDDKENDGARMPSNYGMGSVCWLSLPQLLIAVIHSIVFY